eukprot:CAMPEP_0203817994 /NCGR_PEP_ID=MMETSP0115-20131106/29586_1 /ASSEMBLY_ACC=CAM_ASM_000227 /TAXON_ID=33651 /ORGANISM="Bicosoecid sp, Strain ms1" /LENGTH=364 /DNA_ID=CAMNT_0050726945 /DNA_START=21 /DNA_END=1115 /DNA_ORIENTATION=-
MSSPTAAGGAGGKRRAPTMRPREVVVLGARGVGKSALVVRFVEEFFVDSYNPTIESTFVKKLKFRGERLELRIRDTTGQDEYSTFDPRYAVGVHGFVIVFSVTSKQSLQIADMVHSQVLNSLMGAADAVPRILVGTMTDLDSERKVTAEEGRAMAAKWGCDYVEVSAKSDINVGEAFRRLVAAIQRQAGGVAEPEAECCDGCCACSDLTTGQRACIDRAFAPSLATQLLLSVVVLVSAVKLALDEATGAPHRLALVGTAFGALSVAAAAVGMWAGKTHVDGRLRATTAFCLTVVTANAAALGIVAGLGDGSVRGATATEEVMVAGAVLLSVVHVAVAALAHAERRIGLLLREEAPLLTASDSWA